jgi:hypothetical protein
MPAVDADKVIKIKAGETRAFQESVHRLGGRSLPESHRSNLVEFDPKQYPHHRRGAGGRTCGCGLPARAAIPYTDRSGKGAVAVVCSVCDGAPLYPRIQRERQEHESGVAETDDTREREEA